MESGGSRFDRLAVACAFPLILGAWDSPALFKILHVKEHVEWAAQHGALESVSQFLGDLGHHLLNDAQCSLRIPASLNSPALFSFSAKSRRRTLLVPATIVPFSLACTSSAVFPLRSLPA